MPYYILDILDIPEPVMPMKMRIRGLREDRDLKQRQIAERLRCDQSLYSKYGREKRSLLLEYADKLAGFYGVSLDCLVGSTDVKPTYPKK